LFEWVSVVQGGQGPVCYHYLRTVLKGRREQSFAASLLDQTRTMGVELLATAACGQRQLGGWEKTKTLVCWSDSEMETTGLATEIGPLYLS